MTVTNISAARLASSRDRSPCRKCKPTPTIHCRLAASIRLAAIYELLRGTRTPRYVAFDILWLNGTDLRALTLTERRKNLQGIVSKGSPIVGAGQGARTVRADVWQRPRRYRR